MAFIKDGIKESLRIKLKGEGKTFSDFCKENLKGISYFTFMNQLAGRHELPKAVDKAINKYLGE